MLNKIFKFFKTRKNFNPQNNAQTEEQFHGSLSNLDDKIDNGLDTLAAVKRYVNLKDSPYILKRGNFKNEYFLENSETGSVIMRFRSALKEYAQMTN